MGKDIAKSTRDTYANTRSELVKYKPKTGDTLVNRSGPRTIFHLVTKLNYYNKLYKT